MLNAYLYRVRKSLLKSPLKIVLCILGLALALAMIFVPMLDGYDEMPVVSNQTKYGAINVIMIAEFAFLYFTGLTTGVASFSFADVNFHLAGPFTKKFNLLIAAAGSFQISGLFMFVLCCQSAVLYSAIALVGLEFVIFLLVSFVVMLVAYSLGALIGTLSLSSEKNSKLANYLSYAICFALIGAAVLEAVDTHGSFGAIRENGIRSLIGELGSSMWLQAFPGAGWINMIFRGVALKDTVFIVCGSILSAGLIALIVIMYVKFDFDYYEIAIENAQKIADFTEARRAGVDKDAAKINNNVKVGKETLNKGWGYSAFTQKFFLENSRLTRFFFVNKLTILYRVICFIYLFFIAKMGTSDVSANKDLMITLVPGLMMIIILDLPLYAGGKTILEFNRPYIFLVPEKASKKLFACILGGVPEMLFDAVLCTGIIAFHAKPGALIIIGSFLMFLVFAFLCQLAALVCLRIFKSLGKYMLMIVRYYVVVMFLLIAFIPGIVVGSIVGSVGLALLVAAGVGVLLSLALLAVSRNMLDKVEYGS